MKNLRVASVQFNHTPGDKDHNRGRIRAFVEEAHVEGVDLVVFPEMCATGYWHVRNLTRDEVQSLAEPVPGPSIFVVNIYAPTCGSKTPLG